ncbi:uncharacterized protein N7484_009995 [Penicillium longicatenatum]|uniref:uncharacterized protein n=1 Tax=Penicillium longicatenatum TaxID=1561947 RepID=UPI002547A259|nr:uncharacterized protein N7484_009995 [Penicillium longicatenatum]KAJ5636682.1 hypothetical protein N7484_009995 [Penicillium longicatenatum]
MPLRASHWWLRIVFPCRHFSILRGGTSSISRIFSTVPTCIVDVYLDRPAVIPGIADQATALLVNYGSSESAFFDVIFGKTYPEGKLPFDLPSSMKAVEKSKEDVPFDTELPLFKYGHGLEC